MTFDEAIKHVQDHQPNALYLSGKTSTGKSTFAGQLKESLSYHIIELDEIVRSTTVKAHASVGEGQIFTEVYKRREHLGWIRDFISAAQIRIEDAIQRGQKVIVEGAVAHPETLKELLAGIPGVECYYFSPRNLDVYERNLTNRFRRASKTSNAGLPDKFWKLVDAPSFEQFCLDNIITDKLCAEIHEYAIISQIEADKRFREQSAVIADLKLIEI